MPCQETRPRLLDFRSSQSFIQVTICLAVFTDGVLYALVVPVLPFSLREYSDIPESQIPRWTAYMLTVFGSATLVSSPFVGWLTDNAPSRRFPFLLGLALQAGSTALFAISPRVEVLLLARALQGLSAAVVFSTGLSILVDTVGVSHIGQQAGYFLSSNMIGVLLSPMLGGWIYEMAGYYAVVSMMIGLVVVDIILRLVMIERSERLKWFPEEEVNRLLSQRENVYGTIHPRAGTIVDPEDSRTCAPRLIEVKTATVIPAFLQLLVDPRALASFMAVFVGYVILSGFDAGLPEFAKQLFHWSSKQSGLALFVLAVPQLLSPIAGHFSEVFGPRWIIIGGFLTSAAGLLGIGFISKPETWQVILLFALLIIIGTGLALVFPCLAHDLTAVAEQLAVDQPEIGGASTGPYAQAFALFNCGIAAGTVLGPLWTGFAVPAWGWRLSSVVLALLALLACMPVCLFLKAEQKTKD